jgi:hypothetical protein
MAEPWQPKVGDRVRVRDGLAGTCRETRSQVPPPDAPDSHPGLSQTVDGHRPQEAGAVGTVVPLVPARDPAGDHTVLIRFDSPISMGSVPAGWAQIQDYMYYTASELEPLDA